MKKKPSNLDISRELHRGSITGIKLKQEFANRWQSLKTNMLVKEAKTDASFNSNFKNVATDKQNKTIVKEINITTLKKRPIFQYNMNIHKAINSSRLRSKSRRTNEVGLANNKSFKKLNQTKTSDLIRRD